MPVSQKIRLILWTRAAGRCQYQGCNIPLLGDLISGKEDLNRAYVAHIVAEMPDGPRGDLIRSPALADDVDNLMLLCDAHHRLVDRDGLAEHPESRLLAMKAAHEHRVEVVTGIDDERASHILLYAAKVGEHDCPVRFDLAKQALLPDRYPVDTYGISLNLAGCDYSDHEDGYWAFQPDNLRRQFLRKVRDRIAEGVIRHISVFALAPQPLLIELGRLLSDIPTADVFQIHREPQTWRWRDDGRPLKLITERSESHGRVIALRMALSATIADERIFSALGRKVPIWSIAAAQPHNDCMQGREDLRSFRGMVRRSFDEIKAQHGEQSEIHVFPALPVSAAVEVGRVWMPKSDLPLVIYDNHRIVGGFRPRLRIGQGRVH